jgi:hypothetical protein
VVPTIPEVKIRSVTITKRNGISATTALNHATLAKVEGAGDREVDIAAKEALLKKGL